MSNLIERNGAVMMALFNEAFNTFADTLDYPISDVRIVPTSRPYTMNLKFSCATMWETGNAYDVRKKFQLFALDLFKTFGYMVYVEHPENINAPV